MTERPVDRGPRTAKLEHVSSIMRRVMENAARAAKSHPEPKEQPRAKDRGANEVR